MGYKSVSTKLKSVVEKIVIRSFMAIWIYSLGLNFILLNFSFFSFSGGLSNELFICRLPDNYQIGNAEKRKVVLRIYGPLYDELVTSVAALISDSVVFALLSEWNVGPKLFAIFPEGRLEELLPVSLQSLRVRVREHVVRLLSLKEYYMKHAFQLRENDFKT